MSDAVRRFANSTARFMVIAIRAGADVDDIQEIMADYIYGALQSGDDVKDSIDNAHNIVWKNCNEALPKENSQVIIKCHDGQITDATYDNTGFWKYWVHTEERVIYNQILEFSWAYV